MATVVDAANLPTTPPRAPHGEERRRHCKSQKLGDGTRQEPEESHRTPALAHLRKPSATRTASPRRAPIGGRPWPCQSAQRVWQATQFAHARPTPASERPTRARHTSARTAPQRKHGGRWPGGDRALPHGKCSINHGPTPRRPRIFRRRRRRGRPLAAAASDDGRGNGCESNSTRRRANAELLLGPAHHPPRQQARRWAGTGDADRAEGVRAARALARPSPPYPAAAWPGH